MHGLFLDDTIIKKYTLNRESLVLQKIREERNKHNDE